MLCIVVSSHKATSPRRPHLISDPLGWAGNPPPPPPSPPPSRCLLRAIQSSRLEILLPAGLEALPRRLGGSPHGPCPAGGSGGSPSPDPPGAWPQGPLLSLNRPRPSAPSPVKMLMDPL